MMEDNQNEQQQRQLLLVPKENNLDGKHKKAISLYQIDQGLRRAQDNRLQLYWNQRYVAFFLKTLLNIYLQREVEKTSTKSTRYCRK